MSRSRKKHPVHSRLVAFSEKDDKRLEHRKWRAHLRVALAAENWERAEWDYRTTNWLWAKDGKAWAGGTAWEEKAKRK